MSNGLPGEIGGAATFRCYTLGPISEGEQYVFELAMRSGASTLVKVTGLLGVLLFPWIAANVYDYWAGRTVIWPAPSAANPIHITEASYGLSCRNSAPPAGQANRVKQGNATAAIARLCENALESCTFTADVGDLGDPAPGCAKDLSVSWRCSADSQDRQLRVPEEAHGKSVTLACWAGRSPQARR
jgi:hypothetical protein